jgi:hypothetical protein
MRSWHRQVATTPRHQVIAVQLMLWRPAALAHAACSFAVQLPLA